MEKADKVQDQAQGGGDPIMAARKGPGKGPEEHALDALTGTDEKGLDVGDHKLRLVFKSESLADLLAVFGAEIKAGESKVSFVVPGTKGEKEVGDVIRLLLHKYAEAGITLKELAGLLKK